MKPDHYARSQKALCCGMKVATTLLKEGDIVEVDAEKGPVIRKSI